MCACYVRIDNISLLPLTSRGKCSVWTVFMLLNARMYTIEQNIRTNTQHKRMHHSTKNFSFISPVIAATTAVSQCFTERMHQFHSIKLHFLAHSSFISLPSLFRFSVVSGPLSFSPSNPRYQIPYPRNWKPHTESTATDRQTCMHARKVIVVESNVTTIHNILCCDRYTLTSKSGISICIACARVPIR